jgi:hypothetical protein
MKKVFVGCSTILVGLVAVVLYSIYRGLQGSGSPVLDTNLIANAMQLVEFGGLFAGISFLIKKLLEKK